jgi:predicted RNA-binding protein
MPRLFFVSVTVAAPATIQKTKEARKAMNYYLDLFSPETHAKFTESDQTVSGFRIRQRNTAAKIKPGDILVCYMTRLSRWVGLLRVDSAYFEDSKPIFTSDADPFVVRFKVKPMVWLPPEKGIPIHDEAVWPKLSKTKDYDQSTSTWTGFFRNSLNQWDLSR